MKPFSFRRVLILFAAMISACGTIANAEPTRAVYAPFVLAPPQETVTPTPFQPSGHSSVYPPFFLNYPNATPTYQSLPGAASSPTPPAVPSVDVSQLFPTVAAPPLAEAVAVSPTPLPPFTAPNETINFLLIGSDKRPGSSYRTDTLVVAVVWLNEGQVSLISIPRDLWVYIPNIGMQRINTAYQSGETSGYPGGGPALLKDTVVYNLGIRIDHTAMVEFDGFRRIVDTLGGIEVPIACAYTDWKLIDPGYEPENPDNWQLFTIGPGQVHMDGELALWYARARSKSNDFDRGRRQQEVLRSLFNKALQAEAFKKAPQLYQDFSSAVVTDMSLSEIVRLAPYALNFTNADIRGYYIRPPYVTSWTTPGGAAVLLPNQEALQQLMSEATTLSAYAAAREAIVVEVQNGSPFDSYDALAASRLNYAGYQAALSPADRRDYANSVLVDFTAAQDAAQRQTLLAVLNLPSASVVAMPNGGGSAQYRVILGYDYAPCFQPQDLSH